jgi:hypothetical protein
LGKACPLAESTTVLFKQVFFFPRLNKPYREASWVRFGFFFRVTLEYPDGKNFCPQVTQWRKGFQHKPSANKRKPHGHHKQHIRHHSTSTVGTTVPGVAAVPPAVVSTRRTSRQTTSFRFLVPILHEVLSKTSDYWSEGYGVHFEYHRKFFFESRNCVRPEIQYDLLVSPMCACVPGFLVKFRAPSPKNGHIFWTKYVRCIQHAIEC